MSTFGQGDSGWSAEMVSWKELVYFVIGEDFGGVFALQSIIMIN